MSIDQIISLIQSAIVFGTVIMFGCCGEILTEKSGNLNLGIPGTMYLGGIASLTGAFFYENAVENPNPILCIIIAFTCAFVAGALGGLIYSFLTTTLRANQNVTGLTLTIFGAGIANFFGGSLNKLAGGVGQISVLDAVQDLADFVRGEFPAELDDISFEDLIPWVGEGGDIVAVIGKEQQTLAVHIQPAHRIHPDTAVGNQLRRIGPTLFVGQGGHKASGLVKQDVHILFPGGKGLPFHQDLIHLRIGGISQAGGSTVDTYPTRLDQLLRLPAGADAPGGEYFLQSFFHEFFLPKILSKKWGCFSGSFSMVFP